MRCWMMQGKVYCVDVEVRDNGYPPSIGRLIQPGIGTHRLE